MIISIAEKNQPSKILLADIGYYERITHNVTLSDNVTLSEDGTFKVRAMYDTLDKSLRIAEALIPVKIAGIPFVVRPGTILRDVTLLSSRAPRVSTPTKKQVVISDTKQFADEKDFFAQEESKESRFNLMIKADSEGALDAVDVAVSRINVPGVKLNILHKGVGMITGTDVLLASVSKALIVGFNVTTSDEARREAKAKDVEIRLYRLIFDLIDESEFFIIIM